MSLMPSISRSSRALFSAGVSSHLLSTPPLEPCVGALAPLPVLNFLAFSFVGSTREDQSPFEGGTIIHSSRLVWGGACGPIEFEEECNSSFSARAVDVLAVGKLGPKSSSSLLLSGSVSGPVVGLSSRLAGGKVGPIVRGRFAEESGLCDRLSVGVDECDRSSPSSPSLFRFAAKDGGNCGPTEAMIAQINLVSMLMSCSISSNRCRRALGIVLVRAFKSCQLGHKLMQLANGAMRGKCVRSLILRTKSWKTPSSPSHWSKHSAAMRTRGQCEAH